MRKLRFFGALLVAVLSLGAQEVYTKAKAREIVKTAEKIRSPNKAELDVTLTNNDNGKMTVYDLNIMRSTEKRALIIFRGPAEERGRKMLAVSKSYWSRFPDSKKVVAISRREMIGNSAFAIADMFQIDAEIDYEPTIVGSEGCGKKQCLKLELLAKHADAPYAKIFYWVEDGTSFPVRAQFFGSREKLLKTMTVEKNAQLAGMLRPEEFMMVDHVTKGHNSLWHTRTMMERDVPDQLFSKEQLATE